MCNNWILNGSEMKVGLGIAGVVQNYVSETFFVFDMIWKNWRPITLNQAISSEMFDWSPEAKSWNEQFPWICHDASPTWQTKWDFRRDLVSFPKYITASIISSTVWHCICIIIPLQNVRLERKTSISENHGIKFQFPKMCVCKIFCLLASVHCKPHLQGLDLYIYIYIYAVNLMKQCNAMRTSICG